MTNQRTILWLNGPFGAGKSTTGVHVIGQDPRWHFFDPEWVGYMLRANLHGVEFSDFQDLNSWRLLVPKVAHEIAATTGRDLLAVQSVLNENYWRQIRQGMFALGLQIHHVVLDIEPDALKSRIEADQNDPAAATWRHGHVDSFIASREWMLGAADTVVDVSSQSARSAASEILSSLG